MFKAFKMLASLRGLRGTWFDPFGHTAERRGERALITEYRQHIDLILTRLDASNLDAAVALASLPEHIRGFGHVKEAHLVKARMREAELLAHFSAAVVPIREGIKAA